MNNLFLLWKQIVKNPRALGTVAPSSPYLAKCVVAAANIGANQKIVEVGAGTGPITKYIFPLIEPENFCIVEPNQELLDILQQQYPQANHSGAFVQQLPEVLEVDWMGVGRRRGVFIALVYLSQRICGRGLEAIRSSLSPNGKVLTLVYSHAQYFPSSLYLNFPV